MIRKKVKTPFSAALSVAAIFLIVLSTWVFFSPAATALEEGEENWLVLPILGEGAYTLPKNQFMLTSHVDLMNFKNLLDPTPQFYHSGDEFKYSYRRARSTTELRYGITDIVTAGARVRYSDEEGTDALNPLGLNNASAALGDTDVFLKLRFPDQLSPTDVSITLGLEFPTGNIGETPVTGSGSVDVFFGAHVTTELHKGRIFGDMTYKYVREYTVNANLRPEPRLEYADFLHGIAAKYANTTSQTVDPGSVITWDLGYVYPFTPQFRLCGELYAYRGQVARINGQLVDFSDYNWVFLSPGIQYSPDEDFVVEGTVMIPVSDKTPFHQAAFSIDPSTDYWYRMGIKWKFR